MPANAYSIIPSDNHQQSKTYLKNFVEKSNRLLKSKNAIGLNPLALAATSVMSVFSKEGTNLIKAKKKNKTGARIRAQVHENSQME